MSYFSINLVKVKTSYLTKLKETIVWNGGNISDVISNVLAFLLQDQRHAKLSTAAVFVKRLHDLAGVLQLLSICQRFYLLLYSKFDLPFPPFPLS